MEWERQEEEEDGSRGTGQVRSVTASVQCDLGTQRSSSAASLHNNTDEATTLLNMRHFSFNTMDDNTSKVGRRWKRIMWDFKSRYKKNQL